MEHLRQWAPSEEYFQIILTVWHTIFAMIVMTFNSKVIYTYW